jgi:hypothetical protein
MTLAQEAVDRGMMYPPDPRDTSTVIGGNVYAKRGHNALTPYQKYRSPKLKPAAANSYSTSD